MLSKIILKNFKSYKNETVIDFIKTKYEFLPENISESGVLKETVFVGANASGKSNIILALELLLNLLFREVDINTEIYLCLFSDNNEFDLEYEFLVSNDVIKYHITYNINNKLYEKLWINDIVILHRMGLEAETNFNNEKRTYNEEDINEDTLFLRTIYFNTKFSGNKTLVEWFEFLQNSVLVNPLEKIIKTFNKDNLNIHEYLEKYTTSDINDFLKKHNFNQTIEYVSDYKIGKYFVLSADETKMIFYNREGIDVPIPLSYESKGNQSLINILPAFLRVCKSNGMLLIDEFSSGFHNNLEKLLIKYFIQNSKNSQMIFVTHSTNILTTALFRPDQIYSVNFRGGEGSTVKRFSDEKPRMAQNLEKMYLSGVFEGLPEYDEDQ